MLLFRRRQRWLAVFFGATGVTTSRKAFIPRPGESFSRISICTPALLLLFPISDSVILALLSLSRSASGPAHENRPPQDRQPPPIPNSTKPRPSASQQAVPLQPLIPSKRPLQETQEQVFGLDETGHEIPRKFLPPAPTAISLRPEPVISSLQGSHLVSPHVGHPQACQ